MRAVYAVSCKVGPNLSAITGRMTVNSLRSCISEVERKEQGLGNILSGRLQC